MNETISSSPIRDSHFYSSFYTLKTLQEIFETHTIEPSVKYYTPNVTLDQIVNSDVIVSKQFCGVLYIPSSASIILLFIRNGVTHRMDGPAIQIFRSYSGLNDLPYSYSWRINRRYVQREELLDYYIDNGIDINNITPEDEFLVVEKFGR